jgi:hypothetical protein
MRGGSGRWQRQRKRVRARASCCAAAAAGELLVIIHKRSMRNMGVAERAERAELARSWPRSRACCRYTSGAGRFY